MKTRTLHIRQWTILFLFSFNVQNSEDIEDALIWADAPNSIIAQVQKNVFAGRLDEGFTFSNPLLRRSVSAIGETSSGPEFLNTAVHEITHVAQHMAQEDDIDPLSEEMAYLIGDITSEISDIVCKLSCPHCRHD